VAHLPKFSIFPIRNPTMLLHVLYGSPLPFVQTQCHQLSRLCLSLRQRFFRVYPVEGDDEGATSVPQSWLRFSTQMAMSLILQNPPSLACFRCYDSQHLFGADRFMRQRIYLRAIVNVVPVC